MKLNRLGMGDQGEQVKEVQEALLRLGYSLPKHGAGGIVTLETIDEVEEFAQDYDVKEVHGVPWGWNLESVIVKAVIRRLMEVDKEVAALQDGDVVGIPGTGVDYHDISDAHPRKAARGVRSWGQVTGITLHQTGIMLGNTLKRFQSLKAHIGIPRLSQATVIQVYPLLSLIHI